MIKAVSSGNLYAAAQGGNLNISIDGISGIATTPVWVTGAANLKGPSLPALPSTGKFQITYTNTTCQLNIMDLSGLTLFIWNGVGTASGLNGPYSGTWTKVGESS